MTKLFDRGDIVRIPQGVYLVSDVKYPSAYIILNKQSYGAFDKIVGDGFAQIIYEGSSWHVSITDIFQGEN
jgi:hypothetical protein